jgi:hypothetical protein
MLFNDKELRFFPKPCIAVMVSLDNKRWRLGSHPNQIPLFALKWLKICENIRKLLKNKKIQKLIFCFQKTFYFSN